MKKKNIRKKFKKKSTIFTHTSNLYKEKRERTEWVYHRKMFVNECACIFLENFHFVFLQHTEITTFYELR